MRLCAGNPQRPKLYNSTPIDLLRLLVVEVVPVLLVGPIGREYALVLAALRGSFDGIYSSDSRESDEKFTPGAWGLDPPTLMSAIVDLWRLAEVTGTPSIADHAKCEYIDRT